MLDPQPEHKPLALLKMLRLPDMLPPPEQLWARRSNRLQMRRPNHHRNRRLILTPPEPPPLPLPPDGLLPLPQLDELPPPPDDDPPRKKTANRSQADTGPLAYRAPPRFLTGAARHGTFTPSVSDLPDAYTMWIGGLSIFGRRPERSIMIQTAWGICVVSS